MQLGNLLRSSPDLSGVVRSIATGAARTFGFDEVTVYLNAAEGDVFRAHAVVGRDEARDQAILDTPVPVAAFGPLLAERHQIGCAFFIDHREHEYTDEERRLFPPRRPFPASRRAPSARGSAATNSSCRCAIAPTA